MLTEDIAAKNIASNKNIRTASSKCQLAILETMFNIYAVKDCNALITQKQCASVLSNAIVINYANLVVQLKQH